MCIRDSRSSNGLSEDGKDFLRKAIELGISIDLPIRKKTGCRSFRHMNKVFGGILTVFGAVVFLKIFF